MVVLSKQVEATNEYLEDHELIEKLNGEETRNFAFNQLVRKYQERIYWHIRKMVLDHDDADDVVQEVFIKVWKNLDSFRQDSKLYTWIYRIATNECLNFLKKRKRASFFSISDYEDVLVSKLDHSVSMDGDQVEIKLQKALLTLPDKQRLVFNMKYFEEMKYEDMSEITGTSVGSLKASYHHAVKKIEKFLNSD
ncbi:MAG: sigma-70 family RNA polymerase sigma factor [Cyclobacteriaceae bacterium]|nr:sigma-70 family RNA polymerase sigma factor [Cyclobacteriaceae bacterium]